jgi:hypothetical protein
MLSVLFKKLDDITYEVSVNTSGKILGYLKMDIDGFFYFVPLTTPGSYWSEDVLITIGLKLKELNKEYEQHINTNLK